jgi:hypothetical protein
MAENQVAAGDYLDPDDAERLAARAGGKPPPPFATLENGTSREVAEAEYNDYVAWFNKVGPPA